MTKYCAINSCVSLALRPCSPSRPLTETRLANSYFQTLFSSLRFTSSISRYAVFAHSLIIRWRLPSPQLYRIFPLSHNYYLSSLVFSPDASKPGRILVGKEVHSAKDYDSHVALLRRLWPNPLLRFTVFDETPHKALSGAPQRLSLYSSSTIPPSEPISKLSSPVVPCRNITFPPYPQSFLSPPPPPPPPQPPFTCVVPLPPAPPPIRFSPSTESCSPHECGTAKTAPCCSVVQGKADIHVLLSSFKEDLERILCRTLGPGNVEPLPALNVRDSTCEVPRVDIIPRTEASLVSASANAASRWCFVCKASFSGVWYGCIKCPWHAVVSQFPDNLLIVSRMLPVPHLFLQVAQCSYSELWSFTCRSTTFN